MLRSCPTTTVHHVHEITTTCIRVTLHVQADYKSLISYYLREGFYQHAADEATEQIQRRGNDTYLLYWEGELHAHVCRTLLNRKLSAHLAAAAGLQR